MGFAVTGPVGGGTETDPTALKIASNLSDVANPATARGNLSAASTTHGSGHNRGEADDIIMPMSALCSDPDVRSENFPPAFAGASEVTPSSGSMYVSYFFCQKNITVTKLQVMSGSGTAATGTTGGYIGLFSASTSDYSLTTLGKTANTTTLGSVINTLYEPAIATDGAGGAIASVNLTRGTLYAIGILLVGNTNGRWRGIVGAAPAYLMSGARASTQITGQTAILSSYAAGSIGNHSSCIWFGAAA